MFSERDADSPRSSSTTNPVGSHGDELLRVLGSSLTRVAEAAVAVYVQTVEPEMDVPEVDIAVWAQADGRVTAAAMRLGDSMGTIFSTTCATPSSASAPPSPAWPTGPCTGWRWASSTSSGSHPSRCAPRRPSCSG